jgi:hypothetical protein
MIHSTDGNLHQPAGVSPWFTTRAGRPEPWADAPRLIENSDRLEAHTQ